MQLTRDLTPTFFVLTDDGHLHGYDREDILRCDLAANDPPLQIFKLQPNTLTISYRPVPIAELSSPNLPIAITSTVALLTTSLPSETSNQAT